MPKPVGENGEKNLIQDRLVEARAKKNLSQRALAECLQRIGVDVDKNVITRIETGKRYVTDIELQAFAKILDVSYEYLIDGKE